MPELKKLGEAAKATVEKLKAQVGGAFGVAEGAATGDIGIEPGDLDITEDAA